MWHRYDWYHIPIITKLTSKDKIHKSHSRMNVNGYGCEQLKNYCMLRPMVAEYELFFLGVDGSANHIVREGDLDGICGSILLCVNYLGIDLSCCHLLMTKHLADCIDVRAISQLQGSIGMAKAVKGDVFGDTRGFYPSFHRSVNP